MKSDFNDGCVGDDGMYLISNHVCMKKDLGIHNNLFGGFLLAWLDEAGASLATNICETPLMVTLKMESVLFKLPVKEGNQLKIYGKVLSIGKSSITLQLEARKHSVYTGVQKVVCTTSITFVRIDDDGSSVPISSVVRDRIKETHI